MSMNIKGKGQGQIQNNNIEERVTNPYQKTQITLEPGINATTFQGGQMIPVMYKEVLAGEYLTSWHIDQITRILTPLVPTMGKVFITTKAFFVPHTRVWEDAERYLADKNSLYNIEDNNIGKLPTATVLGSNTYDTRFKRSVISKYGIPNNSSDTTINLLPIRGYRAIMNDFIINKSYEIPAIEWKDTTPTQAEINALNVFERNTQTEYVGAYKIEDAPFRNNYYTDIRPMVMKEWTDDQTIVEADPNGTDWESNPAKINNHLDWQTQFNDAKQSELYAGLNDHEIIAKLGGTSPVYANQVQFLGQLDYEMNYQQITQSSQQTDAEQSPLGTTGSFSYTRANGTIFEHKKFDQHGYIHILVSLNLERYQDNGTPKELLKQRTIDIFRPGIAKKETQLIYSKEISNNEETTEGETVGYQKPWSEYERLPVFTSGQMQSEPLGIDGVTASHWHNMLPYEGFGGTIDKNYFRSSYIVNQVLGRNNILQNVDAEGQFIDDPIMQISEHNVKTSLPIDRATIKGSEIANKR